LKLHNILGVESFKTKQAEERRKIRQELAAEEKQRKAEERAAAKRREIQREISRLEDEGVPDESEAKRRLEEHVAVIRSRACFVEEVKDADTGRVTRYFRHLQQMRSLFANHRYRGESRAQVNALRTSTIFGLPMRSRTLRSMTRSQRLGTFSRIWSTFLVAKTRLWRSTF
jgi:hypothetical protein